MSRKSNLTLGAGLIAVGLLLSYASAMSSSGGLFFWGMIVVGVYRLIVGLSQTASPPSTEELERSLYSETGGRQIVGERCASCEDKIMVQAEGSWCEGCGLAIHTGCDEAHRRELHAEPRRAYR